MTIRTHNAFHLGDNLIHLNFLRRVARANPALTFEHFCHGQYVGAMQSLVTDLPQIQIQEMQTWPAHSIETWRGADGVWYSHPLRHDFGLFHVEHFARLAEKMGVESPIKMPADMFFDAPCLNPETLVFNGPHVILIDSAPQSNQWPEYHPDKMNGLCLNLERRGLRVVRTEELRASGWGLPHLGALAGTARYVIGTAHGPLWVMLNIWAKQSVNKFICFTGNGEELRLAPNVITTPYIERALELL